MAWDPKPVVPVPGPELFLNLGPIRTGQSSDQAVSGSLTRAASDLGINFDLFYEIFHVK